MVDDWMKDAGFPEAQAAGMKRVLEKLAEVPRVAVEPPPGYEARLLARLSEQLPSTKSVVAPKPRSAGWAIWVPQWGWGVAGVLVASLVWSTGSRVVSPLPSAEADFIVATARRASPELVAQWLASIGDRQAYGEVVASADSQLLARDLDEEDLKKLEEVFRGSGLKR